ncbi:MAG: glycosyltransferase [Candidatus Marinimicrobia bacterium]|nr:glycosyltransferase [Candidatus Neomarinimicrobiota bacterium]
MQDHKKLCYLVNDMKSGAVSNLLFILLDGKEREKYQIFIINLSSEKDTAVSIFNHLQIPIISLNATKSSLIKESVFVFRTIRQIKPDIVHTHMGRANIFGGTICKLAGCHISVCTHHTIYNGYPFLTKIGFNLFQRYIDYSIYVSKTVQKSFMPYSHSHIAGCVVYNGVNTNIIFNIIMDTKREKYESILNIDSSNFIIATIGRLIYPKNHIYSLEIIEQISKVHPSIRFLIIGDGPLRSEILNQIEEKKMTNIVRYLGFRSDIIPILKIVDIVLNPSIWEGFSITMLETMAAGKVFIGSDIPQYREAIKSGSNGYLFGLKDIKSFISIIDNLIKNKMMREKISIQARKTVSEKFNSRLMRMEYFKIYHDLFSSKYNR